MITSIIVTWYALGWVTCGLQKMYWRNLPVTLGDVFILIALAPIMFIAMSIVVSLKSMDRLCGGNQYMWKKP